MNNINLDRISSKAIYYSVVDKNKLYSYNATHTSIRNDKETSKINRQGQVEDKIRNVLSDSKENIKNTIPIIKNVNRQLKQDNLLMKIKIEGMKQSYKNISNYFQSLQNQDKDQRIHDLLNDIYKRFTIELENVKEE